MRHFSNWIDGYLQYTERQESPVEFHIWSALSAISVVMGRKCWMNRGYFTLFPNQYIVLIAESATCRKTSAADIAAGFIEAAGAEMVREKLTVAYLYRHLASAMMGGKGSGSSMCIYAPELSTLLGKEAHQSGLVAAITSLYSCPNKAEYRTKAAGIDIIHNPCINILGCTTLDWMSSNMPGESVEGGFTSRVMFIVGEKARHREAFPYLSDKERLLREKLIADLGQVAALAGVFELSPTAIDTYRVWYENAKEPEDIRLKGFSGRKGDHILKVAMCLAASRRDKLLVDDTDIIDSIKLVDAAESNMHIVFRGVAFSRSAKDIDRVLAQIEKLKEVTHSDLLKRNYHYLNSREFAEVITTLKESGKIGEEIVGGKRWYKIL